MATVTTVGKILLKNAVPIEYHRFVDSRELDKKNIGTLFQDLSKTHPQQYKDVVSKLTRLGFEVSTRMGSTVRLADLLPPIDKEKRFAELDKEVDAIKALGLPKSKEQEKINEAYSKFAEAINKEIVEVGLRDNKTLAKVVKAGARGTATQYRQTVFAPIVVNDAKGNVLTEFPVRHSFAEGLSLPEYLAHTFGARQGAVSTKLAVAEAGYFSKQLSRATTTIKVEEHDCGTVNGVDASVDDKDSVGCFLARPIAEYKRNNEITSSMLNSLKDRGFKTINVRSVLTCESSKHFHPGAVCQLCAGRRDKGLPAIGDYVGLTASTTLGEPLSQGTLNVKHESGSARKKASSSGFKLINQIANIPAEVVKYKGIGEGRRYFAQAMREAFESSGLSGVNRRNFELVAKGVIDHVKVTHNEGLGDYLPGSIVSYHNLAKNYTARPDSSSVRPDFAFNKYLEEPVLHYTIGTRVSKSMIDHLRQHGIESVKVNAQKPDFEPEMQRLLDIPIHEHDWMHQLYTTNLERRLLDAVNHGAMSDVKGPSPVPGLAYGVGFGQK
ncbi:MAG: hypothetical protein EBU46_11890 [Nitrosomonadaceae bacterium]|nr:hypothetical protein [Nitrosomonadaceae bacterium]